MNKLILVVPKNDLSLREVGFIVDANILMSNMTHKDGQPVLSYTLKSTVVWFKNDEELSLLQPTTAPSPSVHNPQDLITLGVFNNQMDAEDYLSAIKSISLDDDDNVIIKYEEEEEEEEEQEEDQIDQSE